MNRTFTYTTPALKPLLRCLYKFVQANLSSGPIATRYFIVLLALTSY
ncbi:MULTISPECIES: hypothetical protein [unclassified Mucilaginibacter]